MKHDLSRAHLLGAVAIATLLTASCAPMPLNPPRALTPTTEVFLPGISAPGVDTSPLQPTTVVTSTLPVPPTTLPATAVPSPSAAPEPSLSGPAWQWVSSTFSDGTVLAPGDPARYTLQLLGDGNALVQADCNFGTGTYEESGGSLSFGAIGTTKVACPADSLDSAFLAQLRNAASYTLEPGGGAVELVIVLKDEAGTMRLRAVPGEAEAAPAATLPPMATPTPLPSATLPPVATPTPLPSATLPPVATPTLLPAATLPPAPTPTPLPVRPTPVLLGTPVPVPTAVVTETGSALLEGTAWHLVSLIANGQAIPPVGTTPVTLEVDASGTRVSGVTGCNQYRATFTREGSAVAIVAPSLMTQKTCTADLMVQEVEFIDSLLRSRSYTVLGNEMALYDVSGNEVLVFVRR